jgi:hypothetical protein
MKLRKVRRQVEDGPGALAARRSGPGRAPPAGRDEREGDPRGHRGRQPANDPTHRRPSRRCGRRPGSPPNNPEAAEVEFPPAHPARSTSSDSSPGRHAGRRLPAVRRATRRPARAGARSGSTNTPGRTRPSWSSGRSSTSSRPPTEFMATRPASNWTRSRRSAAGRPPRRPATTGPGTAISSSTGRASRLDVAGDGMPIARPPAECRHQGGDGPSRGPPAPGPHLARQGPAAGAAWPSSRRYVLEATEASVRRVPSEANSSQTALFEDRLVRPLGGGFVPTWRFELVALAAIARCCLEEAGMSFGWKRCRPPTRRSCLGPARRRADGLLDGCLVAMGPKLGRPGAAPRGPWP